MSGWRQLAGGLAITAVVIIIIGVSLSSAIAQNRLLIEPLAPTRTAAPTQTAPARTTPISITNTAEPATMSPTSTTSCAQPEGWQPYTIGIGDTLNSLAADIGIPAEDIAAGNCLTETGLSPGTIIYLPSLPQTALPTLTGTTTPSSTPSPTITPTLFPSQTGMACGPPSGWTLYTVRSGDTLFSLAQATNTTVSLLQFANCLGSSTYIQAGSQIWLPYIPTPTPTKTATPTITPTPTLTSTPSPTTTSPPPTSTATATPPPTSTPTPSPSPEPATPTPSPTDHPPTPTGTPTDTAASYSICSPEPCAPAHSPFSHWPPAR